MVTEAFIITHKKDKAYLDIDRTYRYGGIMLLSDILRKDTVGIYGCTYFEEFDISKWLEALDENDCIVTFEVNKDCDGNINDSIKKCCIDDILFITIKDKKVTEIKNNIGKIIFDGNDEIEDFSVGWLGVVYNYYTSIIENDIKNYDSEYDSYIWGVS
jgi:hypothetical protein